MYLLKNVVKAYAWGSRTKIAHLCAGQCPSAEPQAEVWMGAHELGPSTLSEGGTEVTLAQLIESDSSRVLGESTCKRFGRRLPYLLKILAAETPLSIQVHPSSRQALEGYERENRKGIEISSSQRNYKDPYHKPELICALGRFEALCGFRVDKDIVARQAVLGDSLTERVLRSREHALGYLLGCNAMEREAELSSFLKRCEARKGGDSIGRDCEWAIKLARLYPGDVGVIVSLLLNRVELEANEALYLRAGVLHAYLEGLGVELMACSDNVLRGGLTPKHIDVAELMKVTDFTPREPARVVPSRRGDEWVYETEAQEFELSRIDLSGETRFAPTSPEVLLCVSGVAEAISRRTQLSMRAGGSLFVEGSSDGYSLSGQGQFFRARVPEGV